MPRPPRIDFPGAWHHVMNRGARHQAIFADDADCDAFLELLGTTSARFGLEIHAYALMGNHFHLLIRSQRGRLSLAMRHLQQTWTQTVNRRHGWDGPLFRSRFRSQLVENETYLLTVLAYIHLNPVRARLAASASEAAWTSHPAYLHPQAGPAWLHRDALLAIAGGAKGIEAAVRSVAALPEDLGEELVEGLQATGPHTGQVLRTPPDDREPMDGDAVLIAIEALTGSGLEALRQAEQGPRANPARRFAIWALRRSTDLTQSEVGRLLHLSQRQVQNVELRLKSGVKGPVAAWMAAWEARSENSKIG